MRTPASPCRLVSLSPCLLLLLTIGCAGSRKYTFDVSVQNSTDGPLTIGFIKKGPPQDPRWMSPEDWTNVPPSRQPEYWGMVVPPGKMMADRVTGEMSAGADPVLRVYSGKPTLSEALAISHGTGDRLDLGLHPSGNNNFIITNTGPQGGLAARLRHRQPAAAPAPGQ